MTESNVILSNITDRSDNGKERLKILNFNKHLNSLKVDTTNNSNISSEDLNGSGLHLNRNGKGKLTMNLIKKLRELRRRKLNRNWQQSGQSLAQPQYYVLNSVSNNDCKRKPNIAGTKNLVEIKHASSPADFQDAGNQMNIL